MTERFALYYAPEHGSALAAFGARWLGRDAATGAACIQATVPGVADDVLARATAAPRAYGFHATLKPPFALAPGRSARELLDAVAALAAALAPVAAPALAPEAMGTFLVLRPQGPCPELDALAARCVTALDAFRAPAGPGELARRRAPGLTPGQEAMLARYGFPYVLEEFRFHLTLAGPLAGALADDGLRARMLRALEALARPFAARPLPVREVCVFRQPAEGAPFALLKRFPLAGAA
jgi:putative phosphonate metabolism protein